MGSIWHIGINSPSSITDTFFVQAVSNCWMFPKLAGCSVVVVCLFFWEWKQELERRWRAETWDRTVWVEVQNRGSEKTGGLFRACLRTKLKQRSKAGVGKRERTWTEQICQIDTSSREDIFIFLFFPKSRCKNECVVCFFWFFFKRIKWRRGGVYGENTWWEQDIWRDGAKERSWKLGQYFRLSAVKVSSAVEHAAACVCTRKSTRVQNIYSVSSLCGFVHFFLLLVRVFVASLLLQSDIHWHSLWLNEDNYLLSQQLLTCVLLSLLHLDSAYNTTKPCLWTHTQLTDSGRWRLGGGGGALLSVVCAVYEWESRKTWCTKLKYQVFLLFMNS